MALHLLFKDTSISSILDEDVVLFAYQFTLGTKTMEDMFLGDK
jgi:hypothetical protein